MPLTAATVTSSHLVASAMSGTVSLPNNYRSFNITIIIKITKKCKLSCHSYFFGDRVLLYAAQADLEPLILLVLRPESWDSNYVAWLPLCIS